MNERNSSEVVLWMPQPARLSFPRWEWSTPVRISVLILSTNVFRSFLDDETRVVALCALLPLVPLGCATGCGATGCGWTGTVLFERSNHGIKSFGEDSLQLKQFRGWVRRVVVGLAGSTVFSSWLRCSAVPDLVQIPGPKINCPRGR